MRQFDHNGLLLAEYQGKMFEKSAELPCSSPIFIRRFLHSEHLKDLDKNESYVVSLYVKEGMDSIMGQFGHTEYGRNKYSPAALFWMGYMYRYISYTREQPTAFIMKLFDHRQMNSVYYPYHTQDPEWCVRNLLESKHLTEEVFDDNFRLKEVIRNSDYYKLLCSRLLDKSL